MHDSRLIQMRELARDIKICAAEMLEEGISDGQAMLHVGAMHQLAADIEKRARLTYTVPEPQPCDRHACPKPLGHDGIHQIDFRLSPVCVCGHRKYSHLGEGRCDDGRKLCHCPMFTEKEH